MRYEDWIQRGRGARANAAAGNAPPPPAAPAPQQGLDPYSLQPHERERWLAGQKAGWRKMMGSPRQRAMRQMMRPPIEQASKAEGWYDQPEWLRRDLLREAGYGMRGAPDSEEGG